MKKIILVILLFLVSGCSANYELTIDEDLNFMENISLQAENEIESEKLMRDPWPIKAYYNDPDSGEYPEELEGVEYYTNHLFLNNSFYQKNLSYTFGLSRFKEANSVKSCFEHVYVVEDKRENTITLSTSPKFLCMEDYPSLSMVNIKINVNSQVVASNASQINQNSYEWTITPQNYESSGIILTFKNNKKEENKISEKEVEEPKQSNLFLALGLLGIFIIVMIGILIYKIKKNK